MQSLKKRIYDGWSGSDKFAYTRQVNTFPRPSSRVVPEPTTNWEQTRHFIKLPCPEAEVAASRHMTRQRALWNNITHTEKPKLRAFKRVNVRQGKEFSPQVDPLEAQLRGWANLTSFPKRYVAELYYWWNHHCGRSPTGDFRIFSKAMAFCGVVEPDLLLCIFDFLKAPEKELQLKSRVTFEMFLRTAAVFRLAEESLLEPSVRMPPIFQQKRQPSDCEDGMSHRDVARQNLRIRLLGHFYRGLPRDKTVKQWAASQVDAMLKLLNGDLEAFSAEREERERREAYEKGASS